VDNLYPADHWQPVDENRVLADVYVPDDLDGRGPAETSVIGYVPSVVT